MIRLSMIIVFFLTPFLTLAQTPTPTATPIPLDTFTKLLLHFDGDLNDSSIFRNNVTSQNNASYTLENSVFGSGSLYLNGDNQYLQIFNDTVFKFNSEIDFTVELWFKIGGTQIEKGIVRLFDGQFNVNTIFIQPDQFSAHLGRSELRINSQITGDSLADNKWHHTALVRHNGILILFLDGKELVRSSSQFNIQYSGSFLLIGTATNSTNDTILNEYFKGWIDEFRFSNGIARYTGGDYTVPSTSFEGDPPPTPPTPTYTPTPTPTPQGVFFQGVDLNQNNMVSSPPAGFLNGRVSFGNVLDAGSNDGTGMKIDLNPGQGMLLFSLVPIESPGLMQVTSRIKTSNAEPAVALIALNSSLDGQFSFVNLTSNALPIGTFKEVKLYYDPPDGQMLLGIQAVNSPFSSISTTVMVDEIIAKLNHPSNLTLLNTEVDGTFEGGLERGLGKLFENINNVTGRVIPIFETLTNIAIQLSIQPTDTAANVGTILPNSATYLPGDFFSSVKVKRDSFTTDGTFAMVVTNGIQNYTLFRNIADLPTINSGEYETLIGGASFFENNPSVPITFVVQNGGNNTNSTIVIDDLFLSKR